MTAAADWDAISAGWDCTGGAIPRPNSPVCLFLSADDPVRAASLAIAELNDEDAINLRRYGPRLARALAEMAE